MRAVSEVEDVVGVRAVTTQLTPATRDDKPHATGLCRLKYYRVQALRVLEHNAAESDIQRGWPCRKKLSEVGGRIVGWLVAQKETADIWGANATFESAFQEFNVGGSR